MRIRKAFTLGETLTVLLIVGVVSAITIPVMHISVSKQKNITMLKKLYSSFSINIQATLNEANCASVSCLRKYGRSTYHNGAFTDKRFFKITKECTDTSNGKNSCWANETINGGNDWPRVLSNNRTNFSSYLLDNGAAMSLFDFTGNCTHSGQVKVTATNPATYPAICGIVFFDTNGTKAPNKQGKDRFAYFIMDDPVDDSYLVPFGYKNNNINSVVGTECSSNNIDYNCTGKIMADGWKINY